LISWSPAFIAQKNQKLISLISRSEFGVIVIQSLQSASRQLTS
jgi:hypothetical protein